MTRLCAAHGRPSSHSDTAAQTFRSPSSAGCLTVDTLTQSYRRELLVGRFLLVEVRIEQTNDIIVPKRVGPSDEGSVPRDLVMFDRLR